MGKVLTLIAILIAAFVSSGKAYEVMPLPTASTVEKAPIKGALTKQFGTTTVIVQGVWYNELGAYACTELAKDKKEFVSCLRTVGLIHKTIIKEK